MVLTFIVPLVLLIYCYSSICYVVVKSERTISSRSSKNSNKSVTSRFGFYSKLVIIQNYKSKFLKKFTNSISKFFEFSSINTSKIIRFWSLTVDFRVLINRRLCKILNICPFIFAHTILPANVVGCSGYVHVDHAFRVSDWTFLLL